MKKEELAEILNGVEYGEEITSEQEKQAKEAGLVVVFGYSDDNIEFRGAIDEESGCWVSGNTGTRDIEFTKKGVFLDEEDNEVLEKYGSAVNFNKITAEWQSETEKAAWIYHTEIPHAKFKIMEEGELFCIGIVFSIEDLK